MKSISLLLFSVLLFSNAVKAQEISGIPIIRNFSKSEYNASTQNWSICQGNEGYMYFGNNQGILQYTGYDWQLVEMPNYSIVRCVVNVGTDSILVGAFNELGLLRHDSIGRPEFISWIDRIPMQYRDFGEIWRIYQQNDLTIFQAFKSIIVFKNGEFYKAIVPINEFRFSYLIDNQIYVQEKYRGLYTLNGDSLQEIQGGNFFKDKEIWSLFKLGNDQLLVGTQYNGFFLFQNGKATPWQTEANEFMLKNTLFNGLHLKNHQLAFGSVLNGLIITDLNGKIHLHLNKQSGIQNNTILSISEDNFNNLWLGLDNGIDYIKTSIPLSLVRKSGGFGTGYCSSVFNNSLYAGTNQGLFVRRLDSLINHESAYKDFMLIKGTEGQVWGLYKHNNQLLCGHNSGLFHIRDNKAQLVFDICGVWDVQPIPDNPGLFLVGTYYGFYLLQEKEGVFSILGKIKGTNESARRFFFDKNGFLWMSHGYKGIYQLKLSPDCKSVSTRMVFNSYNDLPRDYNNEVFYIRNKVLATTETGIYEFDYQENKFKYNKHWDAVFGGRARQFSQLIESGTNKIWAFKRGAMQLVSYFNDKLYELNTRSFLMINGTLSRSYENVLSLSPNKFLIGTEDGFVLYRDIETPEINEKIKMRVASIECVINDKQPEITERIPLLDTEPNQLGKIPYRKRHLSVKLSMPFFPSQELVKFKYRVNDGEWSKWLKGNILDINGFSEGTYKIEIQCSIDENEISGETKLYFSILPPLQRSWYAYLSYVILVLGIILFTYYLVKRRIAHEKRKEYLAQKKKRIKQGIELKQKAKEAENELSRLRNEKLQADVIFKSKELANITMSIIQKNLTLGEIKEKLLELTNENSSIKDSPTINQLLRKINKGIEQKDEWKLFEQNFDQVHENFLLNLKEKHPELTAKDMRLAAYLRMNLSSKEIAPLMNISVRSVEISRYRLRKKITIDHNQNLYDYLISL